MLKRDKSKNVTTMDLDVTKSNFRQYWSLLAKIISFSSHLSKIQGFDSRAMIFNKISYGRQLKSFEQHAQCAAGVSDILCIPFL